MKLIFLDFDGPIIPAQSHRTQRPLAEIAWPDSVAALNRITNTTGAKIVISSSWRGTYKLADIVKLLAGWGITGKVIGETPSMFSIQKRMWQTVPRGKEIAAYLKEKKNVEAFVILDDNNDMEDLEPHLILTPYEVGLTEKDADKAIDMLTRKIEVRLA